MQESAGPPPGNIETIIIPRGEGADYGYPSKIAPGLLCLGVKYGRAQVILANQETPRLEPKRIGSNLVRR